MAPAELTLWLLRIIVAGFAVFLCVRQKVIGKFFFFICYFAASIVVSIGRFWVFPRPGHNFMEFLSFYYYSDAVLTIFLALAIWQIGARLVAGKVGRKTVLIGGASILLLVIFCSFASVAPPDSKSIAYFTVEISRIIFFVAGLATLLFWTSNLSNKAEDRIATQFVNVLAVYFAVFFLLDCLGQAWPYSRGHDGNLLSMMGAWLPLGCSFALVRDQ
jgi:hypothetical protein